MKENYLLKLSMLEQKARQLEQELHLINQQNSELDLLKEDMKNIGDSKQDEMLSGLGKGIFIKTKILDKNLLVNVGSNVLVKKTPHQVSELLDEQVKKLNEIKGKIVDEIEKTNKELQGLVEKARSEAKEMQEEIEKGDSGKKKNKVTSKKKKK